MAYESTTTQAPSETDSIGNKAQWWCNFCNFETNDMQEYLSHSCKDVLAKRGVEVEPTGQNECR